MFLNNELIFLFYTVFISLFIIIAAKIGKEALLSLISVQLILVNLFVSKEISLFGITATASDSLSIGIAFSLNLLQEIYSQSVAKKAIFISFFNSIFYIIATFFHKAYLANQTSLLISDAFDLLLSSMPRIIIASLLIYIFIQYLDNKLYAFLSQKLTDKYFLFKNYISITVTQLLDTIFFSFFGLYGTGTFNTVYKIGQIIMISYIIKLVTILISGLFISIAKKFIIKQKAI